MEEHDKQPLLSTDDGSNSYIFPPKEGGVNELCRQFFNESKHIWSLAAPSIVTCICMYALGALTQMFAGHLGTIQLASVSVANSVIANFGYSILMGLGSALETLCGQAYGAKNQLNMLGIYLQRSWIILHAAALAILFPFIFASPLLHFLGQNAAISQGAGKFSLWMIPQQFAYAIMIPLMKFLQAQSRVMEMAVISVVAACLHALLSWALIIKLGLGLIGAALVLNFSWWFMTIALLLYVMAGHCGEAWPGFSWKAFRNLWGFIQLSISSAIMLCLEIWYGMALTLVAGCLKNAEVSVDALSICLAIVGWSGTVGFGFNIAVSVRVANELGSGRPRAAKYSVFLVGLTSFIVGLLFAVIIFVERTRFPALFSSSPEVQELVEELTPLLGLTVIFTCVQYTLSGVAIGAGWQKFVAYLNSGCYFLAGVPFGILMCFKFDTGVKGLWYGMVLGLCLQTILLFWVVCNTNWNNEADTACQRLKQWGGETKAQNDEEK